MVLGCEKGRKSIDNLSELEGEVKSVLSGFNGDFSLNGPTQEPFAGLIRVKKVFPMGPAFQSGQLKPWDIILKANGVSLIGLTNHVSPLWAKLETSEEIGKLGLFP